MFEKILVCLDGSPLAEQILPYIAEESNCFTKAIILKVITDPEVNLPLGIPGESGGPIYSEIMFERFQKEASEMPAYLEARAQPLRDKGLDVECVIIQGKPSEAIIAYAKDNGVGLIAIATHGHSGFRQITLGSTAEYVLKHSGLPVLLVTPQKRRR